MPLSSYSFGEDICPLELRRNVGKRYHLILQSVMNKVIINFNVFGTFIEDGIVCNLNSFSVVSVKRCRISLMKPKFL